MAEYLPDMLLDARGNQKIAGKAWAKWTPSGMH